MFFFKYGVVLNKNIQGNMNSFFAEQNMCITVCIKNVFVFFKMFLVFILPFVCQMMQQGSDV